MYHLYANTHRRMDNPKAQCLQPHYLDGHRNQIAEIVQSRPNLVNTLKQHNIHIHPFNGPFSETTRLSQYQKGKTNLDFTEARDNEWQWHQLGHMQICTSLQTNNHASNPPLSFLQAGCPSCHPTNSVKALKAISSIKWKELWNR